jgi:hypothetical protein
MMWWMIVSGLAVPRAAEAAAWEDANPSKLWHSMIWVGSHAQFDQAGTVVAQARLDKTL